MRKRILDFKRHSNTVKFDKSERKAFKSAFVAKVTLFTGLLAQRQIAADENIGKRTMQFFVHLAPVTLMTIEPKK